MPPGAALGEDSDTRTGAWWAGGAAAAGPSWPASCHRGRLAAVGGCCCGGVSCPAHRGQLPLMLPRHGEGFERCAAAGDDPAAPGSACGPCGWIVLPPAPHGSCGPAAGGRHLLPSRLRPDQRLDGQLGPAASPCAVRPPARSAAPPGPAAAASAAGRAPARRSSPGPAAAAGRRAAAAR